MPQKETSSLDEYISAIEIEEEEKKDNEDVAAELYEDQIQKKKNKKKKKQMISCRIRLNEYQHHKNRKIQSIKLNDADPTQTTNEKT